MKSCKEKAAEWGISSRSVNDMCKKGKVAGAVKENGTWRIPDDAAKPADKRISTGKYVKKSGGKGLKALPIGISDYVRAQSEYYYVDKTLLIKEFLDQKPLVSLFTRPRRFGKTLNMSMQGIVSQSWQEERHNVFHFCQRVTNYLIMKRSSIRPLSHCIMANILWMRIY